jgi:hypothetical protein
VIINKFQTKKIKLQSGKAIIQFLKLVNMNMLTHKHVTLFQGNFFPLFRHWIIFEGEFFPLFRQ